jgi:hypothetical protein
LQHPAKHQTPTARSNQRRFFSTVRICVCEPA